MERREEELSEEGREGDWFGILRMSDSSHEIRDLVVDEQKTKEEMELTRSGALLGCDANGANLTSRLSVP